MVRIGKVRIRSAGARSIRKATVKLLKTSATSLSTHDPTNEIKLFLIVLYTVQIKIN